MAQSSIPQSKSGSSIAHNAIILSNFVRRDLTLSSKGTVFGLLWILFDPLISLAIYTVVFGFIFGGSFHVVEDETKFHYALGIFIGLIIHQQLATSFGGSIGLIRANENLVKKVHFPIELLPLSLAIGAFFRFLVSFTLFAISTLAFTRNLHFNLLHFFFCMTPLLMMSCGTAFLFSALGVFFRDLGHLANFVARVLLYGSAIFYPATAIPASIWTFLKFNPLLHLVDQSRAVFLWGFSPQFLPLFLCNVFGILLFGVGVFFFRRTKKLFPDVL